jgi:hypothetical protein
MNDKSKIIELIELADSYYSPIPEEDREESYSVAEIENAMENHQMPDGLIEMYSCDKTVQFVNSHKELLPGWYFVNLHQITAYLEILNGGDNVK